MAGNGRSISSVVALVESRERVGAVSVLVFEVPDDFVEDGGPDRSRYDESDGDMGEGGKEGDEPDGVNDVKTSGSDPAIGHRVALKGGRVVVFTDTSTIVGPVAHTIVLIAGVGGLEANSSGVEIAPSFTHTTGLKSRKAVNVQGTTGEAVRQTMGVLSPS